MPMCMGYCGAIYENSIQGLGLLQQCSSVRSDHRVVWLVLVFSRSIAIWSNVLSLAADASIAARS